MDETSSIPSIDFDEYLCMCNANFAYSNLRVVYNVLSYRPLAISLRSYLWMVQLRGEYRQLSSKLDQAMRQMELLRCSSYSALTRSPSMGRTNVYTHFYPYY